MFGNEDLMEMIAMAMLSQGRGVVLHMVDVEEPAHKNIYETPEFYGKLGGVIKTAEEYRVDDKQKNIGHQGCCNTSEHKQKPLSSEKIDRLRKLSTKFETRQKKSLQEALGVHHKQSVREAEILKKHMAQKVAKNEQQNNVPTTETKKSKKNSVKSDAEVITKSASELLELIHNKETANKNEVLLKVINSLRELLV